MKIIDQLWFSFQLRITKCAQNIEIRHIFLLTAVVVQHIQTSLTIYIIQYKPAITQFGSDAQLGDVLITIVVFLILYTEI
ncbi:hypothetical protein D3C86_1707670 [compost metagenome]